MRLMLILILSASALLPLGAGAQTADDILNILTRKGTISRSEADSIRSEYTSRQRATDARLDSFPLSLGRSLRLSGYTQVRYQYNQQPSKISGFEFRRARLDFQGDFSSRWGYRLLVDFVGASGTTGSTATGGAIISPTLLDAFVSYKPFDFLKVTAGQFTIPFSLENLTQDRNLEAVDRSQVVSALVARKGDASNGLVDSIGNQNGRDVGIQISGGLGRVANRYIVDYYLAMLNGAGINTLDNNQSKDIDARLVVHPLSVLDIGGSYYNGYDRFISSPAKDQLRIRWGGEIALNLKLLSFRGEYIAGREGSVNPAKHDGWYAQASYFLWPKHLQGVVRYDTYNPSKNAVKTDPASTYYVFGLNYFFNVWTKIQLNYSRRIETPAINNDVFSAQVQLAF